MRNRNCLPVRFAVLLLELTVCGDSGTPELPSFFLPFHKNIFVHWVVVMGCTINCISSHWVDVIVEEVYIFKGRNFVKCFFHPVTISCSVC